MWTLYWFVVAKREISRKAKLSIYRLIYVPTLACGHERSVVTERTRSGIQAAKMSFLHRGEGLGHSGGTQSVATVPPHQKWPAEI